VTRFAGFPVQNQAPPAGAPDAGPVVTSIEEGNPGAFNITDIPSVQDYYIRVQYGGITYWGSCPAGSIAGQSISGTLVGDALDLGADGTAVIARGNDANGNPQIIFYTLGSSPTSVTIDATGFRPTATGSPPLPLGTPQNPWASLTVNTLTTLPLGPDGSAIVTTAQMNAAIAAATGGGLTVPSPPTLTSATASGSQVVLDWTLNSNDGGSAVTSQQVMRSTATGTETVLHTIADGTTLTYTDTTAVNGTTYFYTVVSVNAQGNSGQSNELHATPLASVTVPGAPTLTGAVASSGQVVLTWTLNANNGGSAVTSQSVLRGTTSGTETLLHTISDGTTLTYTDSTVSNGTTYFYEVESVNAIGTSVASNELSALPSGSSMSPPSGFTTANLLLEDNFPGTSLDTTKWTVGIGVGSSLWQNNGKLGAGYSGANMPGAASVALYNASQVSISSSICTIEATPYSGTYASQGYQWLSGALTSLNHFTIPTSGISQWFFQVKCQMPDVSAGMWPAIWFLPSDSSQELDGHEGGWQPNQTSHNYPANTQMHSEIFSGSNPQAIWQMPGGADMSAGYHIYGVNFTPGTGVKLYVDNTLVSTIAATGSVAKAYSILLTLQVAAASTNGWHTTGGTSNQFWLIDEVQLYGK
jgi:hypothetical protein